MKLVSIHEAKTHLSALLTEIEESSERVVICRRGQPVADLVPHERRDRLDPHPLMREVSIQYDPTEPIADDEWPGDGGE